MTDDDMENMLAEEILPSSGFEMSVMEAVHQEAVTPPPLAFPWRWALPGLAAVLAALGMAVWVWIAAIRNPPQNVLVEEQLRELPAVGTGLAVQWIIVAIVTTIVSVFLSLHVTRARN